MFPVVNFIIKMIVMIVIRYVRLLVNITLVNYLLVVIIVAISHLVSLSFVVGVPLGGSINLATFLVPLVTKFFHHLL